VAWANEKLRVCQKLHKHCNVPNELHTLPDRVLKIIDQGPGASLRGANWLDADVKLHESRGETSTYAALSHRWGDEQPLRLLLENHADFQRCIAWSALPKTFQHAIIFARKLGIQFIWIDSLCIVQDSKKDWLEQSGKMAAIYENATITLAATTSEGGRAGMFTEPTELQKGYVTDAKVKVAADGNDERVRQLAQDATGDDVVAFVKHKMVYGDHSFPSHFVSPDLPLLKRGWVYQERLLSPRILHFGGLDLIWECTEDITCYCDTWMSSGSRNPLSHPIKPQHARCVLAPGNEVGRASRWISIVEEYTLLDLTFASDRLVAIAGVAKQVRRGLENKNYMAGLWEGSLLTGLTWARKGPRAFEVQPENPYTGPSWSWVSVPGAIEFPLSRYAGQEPWNPPTIKRINFIRGNDEEFTTLHGGSITLYGKLVRGETRVVRDNYLGKEVQRHYVSRPGDSDKHEAWLDYGTDDEAAREKVHCFEMGSRMEEGAYYLLFLILACKDEKEQVYTRLGLGGCKRDSDIPGENTLFGETYHVQEVTII
jgi:hypothetical protein